MDFDPVAGLAVAVAVTAALELVAVGLARATGAFYAVGLAGLAVVGIVVGEWVMSLWAISLWFLSGSGADGLLAPLWFSRGWLTPVALVGTAAFIHRRRDPARS